MRKEWQPIATQGPISREWLIGNFGGEAGDNDTRALRALRDTFVANDQLFARRNEPSKGVLIPQSARLEPVGARK